MSLKTYLAQHQLELRWKDGAHSVIECTITNDKVLADAKAAFHAAGIDWEEVSGDLHIPVSESLKLGNFGISIKPSAQEAVDAIVANASPVNNPSKSEPLATRHGPVEYRGGPVTRGR